MKRNLLTLIVGVLLLVIFFLLLFVFQVRTSEVKVVTRFNAPVRTVTNAGPYLKWPWPIENVYRFDKRIQGFESDRLDETLTKDSFSLLITVYVGWRIEEPMTFFRIFKDGSIAAAENALGGLVRSSKNGVIGQHPLADLINTDPRQLKFDAIEREMRDNIQAQLSTNQYGMKVEFLGIKKLGLPESVTTAVFARMKSEREKLAAISQNQGEAKAQEIRSEADKNAAGLLDDARSQATIIQGQGEAKAAEYLEIFRQDPTLASFIFRLDALRPALQGRSTLIFDSQTPPFNLFRDFTVTSNAVHRPQP